MGFFGTIKDEAKRNFIARADEAKGEIVYKYPEKNIRMLTQLTVDADEVALFVKDGKVVAVHVGGISYTDLEAMIEKALK